MSVCEVVDDDEVEEVDEEEVFESLQDESSVEG